MDLGLADVGGAGRPIAPYWFGPGTKWHVSQLVVWINNGVLIIFSIFFSQQSPFFLSKKSAGASDLPKSYFRKKQLKISRVKTFICFFWEGGC